jgi:carbon monoxide dehydrogenase subunit G
MAEAEYVTTARLPRELVWEFVSEMDNFAPFFMGYQQHRKENETDSVWVLKGDLGAMTRRIEFRVKITEWSGPERVRFSLVGLNEQLTGEGSFEMTPADVAVAAPAAPPARRGWLARVLEAIFRFFFQLVRGKPRRAEGTGAAPAAGSTRVVFRLRVDPGGPMAPMINAMIKPLMPSFAEDFAGKLLGHLEAKHGLR